MTNKRPQLRISSTADCAEWLRENIGTGPLASMFKRGGKVVHTPRVGEDGYLPMKGSQKGEDEPAQVRAISYPEVAARIQYQYDCYKYDQDKKRVSAMFPYGAARTATEQPDELPNLRQLRGVIHTPIVRPDGTILNQEGYDPETRLLYLPDPGLVVPPVPHSPTEADLCTATDLILEMIAEFPFVNDHSLANYVGALITPLLRELTPPPWKMVAINAHQPGSGKSFLATALRILHGGVFRVELPHGDELSKEITTILDVTTGPVVTFDNVMGVIKAAEFAGLLTNKWWEQRKLGGNEQVKRPNDRLWTATGNNVQVGGDMPRRVLWVTIDPGIPNPETRTGFKIQDFEGWVTDKRGQLIWSLLTMVRAWIVAGRPVTNRGQDVYQTWVQTVAGVLDYAAIPGRFDHEDSVIQPVGVDNEEFATFLRDAHNAMGETSWTVKMLMFKLGNGQGQVPYDSLPGDLAEKAARNPDTVSVLSKSMGRWLLNREGRWCEGCRVVKAGKDRTKMVLWKIEATNVVELTTNHATVV